MAGRNGGKRTPAQERAARAWNKRQREEKASQADQKSRVDAWRAGDYPISDWTDTEIWKGRVGTTPDDDGDQMFWGRGPKLKPKEDRELSAERRRRGMKMIEDLLPSAVGTIADVMIRGFPADRLRAATYLTDRNLGKTPETVVVKAEDPWDTILNGVIDEERSGIEEKPAPARAKAKKRG